MTISYGTIIRFTNGARIGQCDVTGQVGVIEMQLPGMGDVIASHIINGHRDDNVFSRSSFDIVDDAESRDEAIRLGLLPEPPS